jgi:hypothetical protein
MNFNSDQPHEDADDGVSEEIEATIIFDALLESIQAGRAADPERLSASGEVAPEGQAATLRGCPICMVRLACGSRTRHPLRWARAG